MDDEAATLDSQYHRFQLHMQRIKFKLPACGICGAPGNWRFAGVYKIDVNSSEPSAVCSLGTTEIKVTVLPVAKLVCNHCGFLIEFAWNMVEG